MYTSDASTLTADRKTLLLCKAHMSYSYTGLVDYLKESPVGVYSPLHNIHELHYSLINYNSSTTVFLFDVTITCYL